MNGDLGGIFFSGCKGRIGAYMSHKFNVVSPRAEIKLYLFWMEFRQAYSYFHTSIHIIYVRTPCLHTNMLAGVSQVRYMR